MSFRSTLLDPSWDDEAVSLGDVMQIRGARAVRDGSAASFDEDRAISLIDAGPNMGLARNTDGALRSLTRKEAEVLAERLGYSCNETEALLARHQALQNQPPVDEAVLRQRLAQLEANVMARIQRRSVRKKRAEGAS